MCITLILRLYLSKKRLNRAENFRLHNVNAEQSEEVKKMNGIFGRTAKCGGNEYEYTNSTNENG